jgi:hypothetical protein
MTRRRLITVAAQSARRRRERLYALVRRSRSIYPQNRSLRLKWIRARLALGNRQPKVKVGLEQIATFARTTPRQRADEFSTLAPRTMREAGIK